MNKIKILINGIRNGLPILRSVKEMVKPSDQNKEVSTSEKLITVAIELGTVYFVCWVMTKFGVTFEFITELFGLLK